MKIEYVAGLFDGEGMVRIRKYVRSPVHSTYQVAVMIGMGHEGVIRQVCSAFGGSVHINDHSKRNPKHRPQFCWHISSQGAHEFLLKVRPHLIVKAEEVDLALALQTSIDTYKGKLGNRHWEHIDRQKILAYRESLLLSIARLKRPHLHPTI